MVQVDRSGGASSQDVRRASVPTRNEQSTGADLRALALRQRDPDSALSGTLARRSLSVVPDPALQPFLHPKAPNWPRIDLGLDTSVDAGDPRLIDALGAMTCLREGLLPWRDVGVATVVLTADPENLARNRDLLTARFGCIIPGIAPFADIEAAVLARRGTQLDLAARNRVPDAESCRSWARGGMRPLLAIGLLILGVLACLAPATSFSVLAGVAVLTLILSTLLKSAAAIAALFIRDAGVADLPAPSNLPTVSIMVPLYREDRIAARLVARLEQLDYPRDRLDVVLVVELDDHLTRTALAQSILPDWMRVVVTPDSSLKTKPRALNHALDRCRGSIIGIYDAEDAPTPDQIHHIVRRFAHCPPEVVCLQGVLDFYNPRSNWLARCFTMEYAAWFRVLLPGMARLGLAIPLGGTTLFFRREALEEMGAWDAHNVTEDADLGIRLARHGYRTELVPTTTFEEANCAALPWIRQRSRWLKGYMMTYAVHMRDPGLLWRQLGAWKFIGMQVFFLTTLAQFLLAPVMMLFWALTLGWGHVAQPFLPLALTDTMFWIFLWSEAVLLGITLFAMCQTAHRFNPLWALMLHFYFPLGSIAAYKAVWEIFARPFHWDKTAHGLHDPAGGLYSVPVGQA